MQGSYVGHFLESPCTYANANNLTLGRSSDYRLDGSSDTTILILLIVNPVSISPLAAWGEDIPIGQDGESKIMLSR